MYVRTYAFTTSAANIATGLRRTFPIAGIVFTSNKWVNCGRFEQEARTNAG